ncbi:MAG: sensor histidine kinase [Myxococcota bacterium]
MKTGNLLLAGLTFTLALAAALSAPALLRWTRRTNDLERQSLERLRLARIDLSLGLLHASLAGDPTVPWSQAEGLALIAQATETLEETKAGGGLREALARFEAAFAEARREPQPSAATQTRLRIAAAALDAAAARADLELRRDLEDARSARIAVFEALLWGVVVLLSLAGVGFVFAARRQAQADAAVKERELHLRQLALTHPGLFWLQRRDGQVLYLTPGRAALLGEPTEPPGSPLTWLRNLHPDDVARLQGAPVTDLDLELRVVAPGAPQRRVHLRTRTVEDDPTLLAGFVEDRTRERQLEEALRQSEKLELLGRLAGGVVHDINNLLAVLSGALDALAHGTEDERRTALADGTAAIGRAVEITRQLLTFSRKRPVERTALDLNVLVGETAQVVRRLLGKDVELVLATSPVPALLLGERALLEQVLMNLLINARDAMPAGGRITVRTAVDDAHTRLEVEDTGTGIPPEVLPRILEPFFTTKPEGQGTGIGLATVDRVVAQHHGTLHVDTAVGRGTTFRLTFPRARAGQ